MKNILITGAATGIGYGAAKEFLSRNYRVFGSVRKQEDVDKLQKEFGGNFTPLLFDVTNQKAITEAKLFLEKKIANEGLVGLINNAGSIEAGPLMYQPIELFTKYLNILVTGQLMVTQAFLPLLGAKEDCPYKPGRIINISSVNGKMPTPFLGCYVASKHALEGLSNSLRIELQVYGIDVIVIGPGMIKTAIWEKAKDELFEKYKETIYYDAYIKFTDWMKKALPKEAMELNVFSKKLVDIFEKKKPKTRYSIVKNKFKTYSLPKLLSDRTLAKIYAKILGFDKK